MAEQSYAQHAHRPMLTTIAGLFAGPALVLLVAVAIRQPTFLTVGTACLSLAVVTLVWISRSYTVRLQDRIIRLEMLGRLTRLGREGEFSRLSTRQLVALRFAPDAELPALIDRALAENLTSDQIKRGIRSWQPDLHRT